ncbi:cupin [Leptolyngbya sp. Heron Island J]|uniref:cupin domain-containing protein n=1 Tax=Leptolyngbya sp. Heron Island J TaxID=1385935 RepID=UPI0003B9C0E9|nr:cupin domain-containing protein [Leptolyngbya sp. Heron Island J]ESA32503.1 cupin [Leptolyngbya sp. Heron Island J]
MGNPAGQQNPLVKASEINAMDEIEFHHPLNPNSEIHIRPLANAVGFDRIGLSLVRMPPGKESFVYHAHHNEEEWLYILSGRGMAEIGDREVEVGPGDFMGFGLPQAPHHLRNPFSEDLVYLMGGEQLSFDIAVFPRLNKRIIQDGETAYIVDDASLQGLGTLQETE